MMPCAPMPLFEVPEGTDPERLAMVRALARTPLFSGLKPDSLMRLAIFLDAHAVAGEIQGNPGKSEGGEGCGDPGRPFRCGEQ